MFIAIALEHRARAAFYRTKSFRRTRHAAVGLLSRRAQRARQQPPFRDKRLDRCCRVGGAAGAVRLDQYQRESTRRSGSAAALKDAYSHSSSASWLTVPSAMNACTAASALPQCQRASPVSMARTLPSRSTSRLVGSAVTGATLAMVLFTSM